VTRWRVHGARPLYSTDSVSLELADVELTDGTRLEHHIVRSAFDLVAVVVRDEHGVLCLRRYRFIPERWVWDVPAGKIGADETAVDAAVRASVEETGWQPAGVREVTAYHPLPGISDQRVVICVADTAEQVGPPNPNEAELVEWVEPGRARELVAAGEVDGPSLVALLWVLDPPGAGAAPPRRAR
jgi:8-oxo-dGTP pyrophosphatase MutT (NUDIX family)